MFSLPKMPDWQKRATDIANVMDMADNAEARYDDTKSRMEKRKQDIDSSWGEEPAWGKASDDVKTGIALAVDAADGTVNTGDLLPTAQDWQGEGDMTTKAGKQKNLAAKVATLVGKKPVSDDQSINFAAIAHNIANDRYSGDAMGKEWAQNNAGSFTGINSMNPTPTAQTHSKATSQHKTPTTVASNSTPPKAGSFTPTDGPGIESLIQEANRHWPNAKMRITGRARTIRKQASLMANLILKDRKTFNQTYAPRPHIQQMNDWVDANPNATLTQATHAFDGIIRAAVANGAKVSAHLSDNARDISIPKSNQSEIRSFLENSGVSVLDESNSKNGPHWHLDL